MITGFLAGAFDVMHPGYIKMFEECKNHCDNLIVALHKTPEKNGKLKPILSSEDRKYILSSIKFIDDIIEYETEEDLHNILNKLKIDIRFLGDDYKNKNKFTGSELKIKIVYIDRSHDWSTTKFKRMIYEQIKSI